MSSGNTMIQTVKDNRTSFGFWACVSCTAFTAVSLGLMLGRIYSGIGGTRTFAMLGSTGFVLLALFGGGLCYGYGRFILLGLCFCWLGDYLGPIYFEAGVGMFCMAHVAFSGAFLLRGISRAHAVRAIVPMAGISAVIAGWVLWHSPGAWMLVLAYCAIIGTMVVLSAGMATSGWAGRIAFAAAVLFYVSDIFVARGHYVASGRINSFGCYPLYYSACLLFGWSSYFASFGCAEQCTAPMPQAAAEAPDIH